MENFSVKVLFFDLIQKNFGVLIHNPFIGSEEFFENFVGLQENSVGTKDLE